MDISDGQVYSVERQKERDDGWMAVKMGRVGVEVTKRQRLRGGSHPYSLPNHHHHHHHQVLGKCAFLGCPYLSYIPQINHYLTL